MDTEYKMACKIRYYRHIKGLNQGELAQALEIKQQHLSKIECGKIAPNILLLKKIADILEVTVDDLLKNEDV